MEHRVQGLCPARGKACLTCGKENHFAVVCRSAKPAAGGSRGRQHNIHHTVNRARAAAMEQAHEEAFCEDRGEDGTDGPITSAITMLPLEMPYIATIMGRDRPGPLRPLARVSVQVNPAGSRPGTQFKVPFLPDTGSNITALPATLLPATYQMMRTALTAPAQADGSPGLLHPLGFTKARLTFDGRHHEEDIYVLQGLDRPLLSKWACLALQIYNSTVVGDQLKKAKTPLYDIDNKLFDQYATVNYMRQRAEHTPLTWQAPPAPPTQKEIPAEIREAAWRGLQQQFPRPLDGQCRAMHGGQVHIKVKREAQPRSVYSCQNVPIPLQAAFAREIEEQLAAGIIERADDANNPAPLISPTVVTRKKDATKVRLTVDLRELNKATYRPPFLSPSPWQVVTQIPLTAQFFTVLDGLKGFHQLELDEPSRPWTTFATPLGRFRYRRMPMGWHGSSDIFNERMDAIFRRAPRTHRIVEDLLVASDTWEQHLGDVAEILRLATQHNVSINTTKIQFGRRVVKFGGFKVQGGHYRIDEDLTADLRDFPRPTTRTELRSFLGLVQQLGNFTPEITEMVAPLRGLNKNDVAWQWTPEMEEAFTVTRRTLASPPYLTFFDPGRPTELLADASRTRGLGFLLRQRGPDNVWRTVQCGSRVLAKHEANWSGMAEIEALGVAWAVNRCAYFLDGLPHFTIITDSNPLVPILNERRMDQVRNDRMLKLKTLLERYTFTLSGSRGQSTWWLMHSPAPLRGPQRRRTCCSAQKRRRTVNTSSCQH
jgi:hypothetical protein